MFSLYACRDQMRSLKLQQKLQPWKVQVSPFWPIWIFQTHNGSSRGAISHQKVGSWFHKAFRGLKKYEHLHTYFVGEFSNVLFYCFLHVIAAVKERMETQIDSISKLAQGVKAKVETLDKAVKCPFPSDLCQSILIVHIEITRAHMSDLNICVHVLGNVHCKKSFLFPVFAEYCQSENQGLPWGLQHRQDSNGYYNVSSKTDRVSMKD